MSTSFSGFLVDQLYSFFLGREADEGGRAFWIGRLEAGATFAELEIAFALSDEAQERGEIGPPEPAPEPPAPDPEPAPEPVPAPAPEPEPVGNPFGIVDGNGVQLSPGDEVLYLGEIHTVTDGFRPDAVRIAPWPGNIIAIGDDGRFDGATIIGPDAFDFA